MIWTREVLVFLMGNLSADIYISSFTDIIVSASTFCMHCNTNLYYVFIVYHWPQLKKKKKTYKSQVAVSLYHPEAVSCVTRKQSRVSGIVGRRKKLKSVCEVVVCTLPRSRRLPRKTKKTRQIRKPGMCSV